MAKFKIVSRVLTDEEANEKYGLIYINELHTQLKALKENIDIMLSKHLKLGQKDYEDLFHIHEIANALKKVNDRIESLDEDLSISRRYL